jgi:hypothetical protein
MIGSAIVYSGFVLAAAGLVLAVRPIQWLRVSTRSRALVVAGAGVLLAGVGLLLPASESRITQVQARLDEFAPAWQFREFHTIRVAAPPATVFEAMKRVRADEIFLFRTLTWIRRGGRQLPPSILNAGDREPLIDVATRTGFVRLADDAPRELVIGTVVMAPPAAQQPLTPQLFREELAPGFALAAMNFVVVPDGPGRSLVSTETRVFATSPSARRRFAAYWRVIYPGSALIRRMWLRAIERRATDPTGDSRRRGSPRLADGVGKRVPRRPVVQARRGHPNLPTPAVRQGKGVVAVLEDFDSEGTHLVGPRTQAFLVGSVGFRAGVLAPVGMHGHRPR